MLAESVQVANWNPYLWVPAYRFGIDPVIVQTQWTVVDTVRAMQSVYIMDAIQAANQQKPPKPPKR